MKESTLFKSVFNATPIIIGILSCDGTFIHYNESFKKVSGYGDDELKNMSIRDIIAPDDYEEVTKNFTSLVRGELDSFRVTRKFICKHGAVFWADVSSSTICGHDGQVAAVTCTAFDMTSQNNMEVALRDRNENMEKLFEKKGDAVVVLDEEMRIIRVNRIFEEISGYSGAEVGRTRCLSELIHKEDVGKLMRYHRQRREHPGGVPEAYGCRMIDSTGAVHEHRVKVSMIPGTGRSLVAIKDCMPKESAGRGGGKKDETFRLIAENSTDVVFITDLDLAVTYVSPSVRRVTGYSQEEFKLLKLQEFFSEDSYGRAKQMLKEGLLGGYNAQVPLTTEYKCLHKDGTSRWIETITKLILSEYGHPVGITGASRDITERKRAEEALRRSEIKYRMLTEEIKDVVFGLTPDLCIDYISPVVAEFSGYLPEEMNHTHISTYLMNPQELDTATVLLEQAFSGNATSTTYDFRFRAKDRPDFYVEVSCNPIYEGGKVILLQCVARDVTQRKQAEVALKEREQQLSVENIYLKRSIQKSERFGNIIGKSEAMQRVYELIIQAASSPANVVISGESGTGKELAARAIHDMSPRADKPFVPVNCGAIPDTIIESEFFGYKKGAFTGAVCDKAGFLDLADGGTLFLDEVGEIGLNMQVKLLRALEGGGYTPIGSNQVKHSVFSIVAATNRDLTDLVRTRNMREDFFFRIHVIPIRLPPLRQRAEDIPLLIDHFFMKAGTDKPLPRISSKIRRAFMGYSWPGNVRELQNVLNRFLALNKVDFTGLPGGEASMPPGRALGNVSAGGDSCTLASQVERFEKEIIQSHLNRYQWNRSRVAQVLKIDRKTLASKIKKFKIAPVDEE
ncbi:sigma-54-dependent Fis family transcriptional regulator [Desulfoluna spongiiphila]|uniref:PAS domain S-box-containing protein n=1 Tax=Desulfoluna spongiiphila TaxID=419481 RepID=A0A1G5DYL1_9BACT|nr:sigma-54-dependent Fis family transcriptional regulator [Desulfoluna spongiiphila]SCY19600.1 PAS domain S-box-containing protein [Desulfoluna spongiiphila]VVS91486.1 pas fold [Desulfoluna spongiiphila]